MDQIATDQAPTYDLPFSQAIVRNGFVFVSGQVPVDPETGDVVGDGIEAQTRQAMQNIAAILDAAGSSTDDIVKTTAYLTDVDDFGGFNEAYSEFVSDPMPARSAFEVSDLAIDITVEIDVVAAVDDR